MILRLETFNLARARVIISDSALPIRVTRFDIFDSFPSYVFTINENKYNGVI